MRIRNIEWNTEAMLSATDSLRKNMMKRTKKYNTFANIMLILAAVYSLFLIPATVVGLYKLYHGMDIASFAYRYAGNTALGISVMVLRLILSFATPILWLIWIVYIFTDKKSLRIPVIVTFSYYVIDLIYYAMTYFIDSEGILILLKDHYIALIIMAAWLVFVIKDDKFHRLVFTIIRSLALVLSVIFDISFIVRIVGNRLKFETPFFYTDYLTFAECIFTDVIIALFIIWIFNPKVYLRSIHQEER